jgi:hypothetical protein
MITDLETRGDDTLVNTRSDFSGYRFLKIFQWGMGKKELIPGVSCY